ncbi:Guanylate-binding protein [Phytophthora palmivora]|uniref:Guanylate-binding protein n=1 Tax=Phytophthora palmivora TaxID=4796 RepID=A0A2P4XKD1_9STRA|nr:Guanylate-binding protein [Phytophthora palmivora]
MTDELLFSGQLLAVTTAAHVQIQKEAISFLQRLAEPVLVVSFHGARDSGKTALIQSLLGLEEKTDFDGVWLYVKRANFPNAKYLAILDRPGFGDAHVDVLLYSILAGLSSVVIHHVDGHLTPEAVDKFAFLAANEKDSDAPPAYSFPQSPKLLWVLQNVTTSELKEQVQEISMLAHRDNVFKLYKLRMSEKLGSIVDISDLKGFQPALATAQEHSEVVELPCENDALHEIHESARREAKATLRTMPVRSGKLSTLLKKLFRDLVESVFTTIEEENNRISSDICQTLLATLHIKMTEKVDAHLMLGPQDDGDSYSFQSTEFKRFFHHYQTYMFELMAEYTDQAKGPVKKEELAKFMHNIIRPQLAEFSEKLDKIRQRDVDVVDAEIEKKEEEVEDFNRKQKLYQKQTIDVQEDVNRQLVESAKLHSLRKEALVGAINDLTRMHAMAAKQKELLEEAAFVSVQLPEQKVIEAAQEKEEVTELQGYLIKQGGGGNVFNPLGRKNWKQRYFILIGANLIYASTKDDYERGKIIKELCLTGCKIDPSRDAGEGFDITPGKSAHVFELQRGFFEKNSKKRSSAADSGRVFKLRAQNIQERDVWIDKLRQAAGGY